MAVDVREAVVVVPPTPFAYAFSRQALSDPDEAPTANTFLAVAGSMTVPSYESAPSLPAATITRKSSC